jgi:hypothetical protein
VGRQKWSTRYTVEDSLALDVSNVIRSRTLHDRLGVPLIHSWIGPGGEERAKIRSWTQPVSGGGLVVFLDYTVGGKTSMRYTVQLSSSKCPRGRRYWFHCPGARDGIVCRRRVKLLHLPPDALRFACRECHNLTYRPCQQHDKRVDRLLRSPADLLLALKSPDVRQQLLAVKASTKRLEQLRRRMAGRQHDRAPCGPT